jgi:hypothetical protein
MKKINKYEKNKNNRRINVLKEENNNNDKGTKLSG